jgi:N-acetyl-anhydromuramoyl-L-alanine amidase
MSPEGWLEDVRRVESPNCDDRPPDAEISLLIVHSISLPPGQYGGDAIERFFTNRLDPKAHPYFQEISGMRVSAHFLVRRDGEVIQFVPALKRAWHAGVSSWRGRAACNDFSIGVELEGTDDGPFEEAQYQALDALVRRLRRALPLRDIAAHSDVAPERKTDPGAGFAWARLLARLSQA